jgi:monoamine oxidase
MPPVDVIVVGAGVAGLTAAADLAPHVASVTLLESSDRIGGRVHTIFPAEANGPIELGAEFVHGTPEPFTAFLNERNLTLEEMDGRMLRSDNGQLTSGGDFFPRVMELLGSLRDSGADRTFAEFLSTDGQRFDEETRRSAAEYVSGFHAADPARVSEHAIAKSTKTGAREHSDDAFRLVRGYEQVVDALAASLPKNVQLLRRKQVMLIDWRKHHVSVRCADGSNYSAESAIITVPLPIWDRITFAPELAHKRAALEKLAMGPVLRISLAFTQSWWHEVQQGKARDLSFLFSHHKLLPTWWSGLKSQPALLTGWSAAHRATELSQLSAEAICNAAITALADNFAVSRQEIEPLLYGYWTHNWQTDPHILGCYSYTLKGGSAAPRELAAPVDSTIFVAGEATDFTGDNGTVHAAFNSGRRAARELLDAQKES